MQSCYELCCWCSAFKYWCVSVEVTSSLLRALVDNYHINTQSNLRVEKQWLTLTLVWMRLSITYPFQSHWLQVVTYSYTSLNEAVNHTSVSKSLIESSDLLLHWFEWGCQSHIRIEVTDCKQWLTLTLVWMRLYVTNAFKCAKLFSEEHIPHVYTCTSAFCNRLPRSS